MRGDEPGMNARRVAGSGSNAKPYQVRQVRDIIVKYKLGERV